MELSSLLNSQKDDRLTVEEFQQLHAKRNVTETLNRIRSVTTYEYPTDIGETFLYFNNFIQLLLSCSTNADEELYTASNTRAVVVNALHSFISGLMRKHKLSWLVESAKHFAAETWKDLHDNNTILVYLYGLVLAAFLNNPQQPLPATDALAAEAERHIQGLLCFILSNSAEILAHLWMNCCSTFDEEELNTVVNTNKAVEAYMRKLETSLQKQQVTTEAVFGMLNILQTSDISALSTTIEQQLGNALPRPPFTNDDVDVGWMYFENICKSRANSCVNIVKLYTEFKNDTESRKHMPVSLSNPLLNADLLEGTPSDKYEQTEAVRMGLRFWLRQMSSLTPEAFDNYLRMAILHHYPTERRTVLDLVIADWALRDRFHRHLPLILETITLQMKGSSDTAQDTSFTTKRKNNKNKIEKKRQVPSVTVVKYNRRSAPFYAITQLFDIPDEQDYHQQAQKQQLEQPSGELALFDTALSYKIRSGALIDLTQFTGSSDIQLMIGCCKLLQRMTLSYTSRPEIIHWAIDCLKSANTDIIKFYTQWLVDEMEKLAKEGPITKHPAFCDFLKALLKSCTEFASDIVPIIIESFSEQNLSWLLQQDAASTKIILLYFDDGPQASKNTVVTKLLKTKSKTFVDCLLSFLKEHMSGTDPKLPRSRAWFRNHFLVNILNLAGEEDKGGNSVASRIYRHLFKTRNDFEWYFSTPLIPSSQVTFKNISFATTHKIHGVMHTGLASLFQEMVQLPDNGKKQNLVNTWMELWTIKVEDNQHTFTVPLSWILQCIGLYDQAPVLLKQMIRQLIDIGFQQANSSDVVQMHLSQSSLDRGFLYHIMDLVLLSDAPDSDSLFDLVLSTTSQRADISEQIISIVIHTMIELFEELELEMMTNNIPLTYAKLTRLKNGNERVQMKKRKVSRRRLRVIMRKHNEELERYLQDIDQYNNSVKALTTLAQRIFNFLLRLLNTASSSSTFDSADSILMLKNQFQRQLILTPLFYEPLGKLARLLREPRDLQEDIQTVMDLSLDLLKKQADDDIHEACQKILSNP